MRKDLQKKKNYSFSLLDLNAVRAPKPRNEIGPKS